MTSFDDLKFSETLLNLASKEELNFNAQLS